MLRVGLTGGIASGKSTVGRMFVDLGARLIDGASLDTTVPKVVRTVLGELIFNKPQARERLNSIVHPAVIQEQKDWLDELASREPDAVGIVDAALMIEVGTYRNYEKLIVVVGE